MLVFPKEYPSLSSIRGKTKNIVCVFLHSKNNVKFRSICNWVMSSSINHKFLKSVNSKLCSAADDLFPKKCLTQLSGAVVVVVGGAE